MNRMDWVKVLVMTMDCMDCVKVWILNDKLWAVWRLGLSQPFSAPWHEWHKTKWTWKVDDANGVIFSKNIILKHSCHRCQFLYVKFCMTVWGAVNVYTVGQRFVCKSLVLLVLLHGFETWTLNCDLERCVEAFGTKYLHWIIVSLEWPCRTSDYVKLNWDLFGDGTAAWGLAQMDRGEWRWWVSEAMNHQACAAHVNGWGMLVEPAGWYLRWMGSCMGAYSVGLSGVEMLSDWSDVPLGVRSPFVSIGFLPLTEMKLSVTRFNGTGRTADHIQSHTCPGWGGFTHFLRSMATQPRGQHL